MVRLELCKVHYNDFVDFQTKTGDCANIKPVKVSTCDCYYCKSNIAIVTARYSNTQDGISRDVGSSCEGGVCPVR